MQRTGQCGYKKEMFHSLRLSFSSAGWFFSWLGEEAAGRGD
jgi:hypothetical protein